MERSMDSGSKPAVIGGLVLSLSNFLGNTYVETAIKGLIGGIVGYGGKLLLTWGMKQFKEKTNKKANKPKK